MANDIVVIEVSQVQAPIPSTFQQTGAMVSQGGTSTAAGTRSLITQIADYTAIVAGAKPLASVTWLSGVATATTTAAHGWTTGDTTAVVVAGVVGATVANGYNGTFQATITGANTFTFPVATNPGLATVTAGIVTDEDVTELTEAITTFFSNGSSVSVYILELGQAADTAVEGVAALTTYLQANPLQNYVYLIPRSWDGVAQFVALAKTNAANTSLVYFAVTTSFANHTQYIGTKSVLYLVENGTLLSTEFSIASQMWQMLSGNPSATSKIPPFAFRYLQGVTANTTLTAPQLTTLKADFGNYVDTGAEGGISNTIIKFGTTADGRDFSYWYSVDWVQINLKRDLANEIINGSNNLINPLDYDQAGINRLKARAQSTMNRGGTYGLVLLPVTVTATDFLTYTTNNPNDYPKGIYNGLTVTYTPQRGFTQIIFALTVTDFVSGS